MDLHEKGISEALDELSLENTEELLQSLQDVDAAECSLEEILAEFRTDKPGKADIRQVWTNGGEIPRPDVLLFREQPRGAACPPEEAMAGETEPEEDADPAEEPEENGASHGMRAEEKERGTDLPGSVPGRRGILFFRKRPAAEETEEKTTESMNADRQEHPPDCTRQREEREETSEPGREAVLPEEAAAQLAGGLKGLKIRIFLVLLVCIPMCYLTVWDKVNLPMPPFVGDTYPLRVFALLGLQAAAIFLGIGVVSRGLYALVRLKPGAETAVAVSCIASLTDAATMLTLTDRGTNLPYCAISAVALLFAMWGNYLRRCGMKDACRAAGASANPFVVFRTAEEGFFKKRGSTAGFMTGWEARDASERVFSRIIPTAMLASLLFSLMASAGHGNIRGFFWCYAVLTAAVATFSGTLAFGLPLALLSRRLFHTGAGLAGWTGCRAAASAGTITLTDGDLFPPGTVSINGIKLFGEHSLETVTSYAASVLAASGSGLNRIFCEMVKTQGGNLRQPDNFSFYENGGYSAELEGRTILAGSSDFMALMGVSLPRDMKLKNGVFLAIDGSLAGVFAVMYSANDGIRSALSCLMRSKLIPVFAVRDFNITPSMLSKKFRMSFARCEYPPIKKRLSLSEMREGAEAAPTAVLCREGLVPYADAVVGGRRLHTAVCANAAIASAGSVLGMLICFYLTYIAAYDAASPFHLLLFLLMWTIPTFLISGWVNRF